MAMRSRVFGIAAVLLGLAPLACHRPTPPPSEPPKILVSVPVEKEITDYTDFTGQLSPVDSVEIRARVFGFLEKVNFQEGALVKKGDILYEIDPRTYQVLVNQAKAKVENDEAQVRYTQANYTRIAGLSKTNAGSKDEFDKAVQDRDVAAATLLADRADLASKQLDLDFTKVIAPVDGRIGRLQVTVGNLVQSGQTGGTLLTTIVSVDPMYCLFDVDEQTLLRVQKLIREGKAESARSSTRPVMLALSNEKDFPHHGTINFVDNKVNVKTGTLQLRGVFPNPDGMLSPGLFARVRVPIGNPHKAILVSERAIDTDQGQKILYLLDAENKVFTRPVRTGAIHGGLRVIEDGLQPGERIVVEGLQQIKPDMQVEPKLVPMPVAGMPDATAKSK